MKIRIFLAVLFFASIAGAQKLPFIVGGVVETAHGVLDDGTDGTGFNRMTPFVGAWVRGIGYFRIGYGLYNYSRTDDLGEHLSVRSRALNGTLGVSLGSPERPYLIGSFTRAKILSNVGDVTWNEWGVGGGATFQLLPTAAFVTELEYRWVLSHYNPVESERVRGSRLQFNFGFIIYVY